MPSATTADNSDSIAARIAIVTAGITSRFTSENSNSGTANDGSELGIPPKRARIVSTSNPERATSGVRMKIAPIMPGTRLRHGFGQ